MLQPSAKKVNILNIFYICSDMISVVKQSDLDFQGSKCIGSGNALFLPNLNLGFYVFFFLFLNVTASLC